MEAVSGWQRRDFVQGAALLALALGIPVAAVEFSGLDPAAAPSPRRRVLLRQVSQLVIPQTATPGAGDVGAGDFVLLALAHGLEGTSNPVMTPLQPGFTRFLRGDDCFDHAGWLEAELDRRANGDFLALPEAKQANLLESLDKEAFAAEGEHPWKPLKTLVLTGYYTSEAGGSQELRYELVPGHWDPDLPATPGSVAFSSDWTAVDFG